MLAFGLALCLGLVAAHYLSGVAPRLAANRDLEIALISDRAPKVFIYHAFSKTITVINLPPARLKNGGSNYQKACAALALVSGKIPGQREDVLYLATDDPTHSGCVGDDLGAFYAMLNSWRSRPRLFFEVARRLWLLKKEERTNISFHDLLLAVLELSRLNSSNFIITDFERSVLRAVASENFGANETGGSTNSETGVPAAVVRVEVLNASGKKDLAVKVTKYLRKKGFDVINFGTYERAAGQTKIVNCSGNMEAARAVRSALGLTGLEIYSKPKAGYVAEVSVVLGADFNEIILKN